MAESKPRRHSDRKTRYEFLCLNENFDFLYSLANTRRCTIPELLNEMIAESIAKFRKMSSASKKTQ